MSGRATIIIPVVDGEAERARRALDWYSGRLLRIAVVDGTWDGALRGCRTPDTAWLPRPGLDWVTLATEGVGLVTTAYAVIADPDTLILPRSIAPCVSWLDAHPDHAGVQGRPMLAYRVDGEIEFEPLDAYAMHQIVSADEPAGRIAQAFDPYLDQTRTVLRTDTLRDAFWGVARQDGIVHRSLAEILLAVVASTNGKMRLLPLASSITELRPGRSPEPGLPELLNDPAVQPEIEAFLVGAVTHVVRNGGLGESAAKIAVRSALDVYLNRHLPRVWRFDAMTPEERAQQAAHVRGWPRADDADLADARTLLKERRARVS